MLKNILIAILALPWVLFLYKLSRGQVTFTREKEPVAAANTEFGSPFYGWRMSEELNNILNRDRGD